MEHDVTDNEHLVRTVIFVAHVRPKRHRIGSMLLSPKVVVSQCHVYMVTASLMLRYEPRGEFSYHGAPKGRNFFAGQFLNVCGVFELNDHFISMWCV